MPAPDFTNVCTKRSTHFSSVFHKLAPGPESVSCKLGWIQRQFISSLLSTCCHLCSWEWQCYSERTGRASQLRLQVGVALGHSAPFCATQQAVTSCCTRLLSPQIMSSLPQPPGVSLDTGASPKSCPSLPWGPHLASQAQLPAQVQLAELSSQPLMTCLCPALLMSKLHLSLLPALPLSL